MTIRSTNQGDPSADRPDLILPSEIKKLGQNQYVSNLPILIFNSKGLTMNDLLTLPTPTGTPNRVEWATRIRTEKLTDATDAEVAVLSQIADSLWWINHRFYQLRGDLGLVRYAEHQLAGAPLPYIAVCRDGVTPVPEIQCMVGTPKQIRAAKSIAHEKMQQANQDDALLLASVNSAPFWLGHSKKPTRGRYGVIYFARLWIARESLAITRKPQQMPE